MPPTPPAKAAIASFLERCRQALPGKQIGEACRTRCIGWDMETSSRICGLVANGEKTGTFSLPWLFARDPATKPEIGDFVVLSTYDGTPQALLQTVGLALLDFQDIDASHTALDGPSVRDLDVWRGIHTKYWNGLLEPLGKSVVGDMPVVVERFVCLHPAAAKAA